MSASPAAAALSELLKILMRRAAMMASTLFYGWTLHRAHAGYLNEVWGYLGFTFAPVSANDTLFAGALLMIGGAAMPSRLQTPSSVVLMLLFAAVYVPAIVITTAIMPGALDRYGSILLALAMGFLIASGLNLARPQLQTTPTGVPGNRAVHLLAVVWVGLCVVLIVSFGSVMRFVGEDELYEQRALGASSNLFLGYSQVMLSNIIGSALIAMGLLRREWLLVVMGAAGCLLVYMINAQRTVFLLPFAIICLHTLLHSRMSLFRWIPLQLFLLGLVVVGANAWHSESVLAEQLARHFVFRTVTVPGLTYSQYFEVFSDGGYTWWGHVRGISFLVPPPDRFVGNPLWPGLGYIVGDTIHQQPTFNINANLFSGDGIAAAGEFGVLVISVALGAWLWILDRAVRCWDPRFVLLVVMPLGLTLTNGHLTTMLLSYGGLLWTVVFLFFKPKPAVTIQNAPPHTPEFLR